MDQFARAGDHSKAKEYEHLMKSFCLDYGVDDGLVMQGPAGNNDVPNKRAQGFPEGEVECSLADILGQP